MVSEEEFKRREKMYEEFCKEPEKPILISDNPVIQGFFERFESDTISDQEYLNLRDEIIEYMKEKGTKEDEEALQEFMESLLIICDSIESSY